MGTQTSVDRWFYDQLDCIKSILDLKLTTEQVLVNVLTQDLPEEYAHEIRQSLRSKFPDRDNSNFTGEEIKMAYNDSIAIRNVPPARSLVPISLHNVQVKQNTKNRNNRKKNKSGYNGGVVKNQGDNQQSNAGNAQGGNQQPNAGDNQGGNNNRGNLQQQQGNNQSGTQQPQQGSNNSWGSLRLGHCIKMCSVLPQMKQNLWPPQELLIPCCGCLIVTLLLLKVPTVVVACVGLLVATLIVTCIGLLVVTLIVFNYPSIIPTFVPFPIPI